MVGKFFIDIINLVIKLVGGILGLLISFLPNSPFNIIYNSSFGEILSQVNYLIPIAEMVVILESWLFAITGYYVYSIFARWLKAIE